MSAPQPASLADFTLTPKQAVARQRELAAAIQECPLRPPVKLIGGVDVGFEAGGSITRAAAVLLDADTLELRASAVARQPTCFPYVPGLLSFRETPAALAAIEQLPQRPDLLLCDGHGRAHPRRFGYACHVGLLLDLPTIGVGKTRLCGEHAPLPEHAGASVELIDRDEIIGVVLRSRQSVRPIYVSVGHRVTLPEALAQVQRCLAGRRLPEPVRIADRLASRRDDR